MNIDSTPCEKTQSSSSVLFLKINHFFEELFGTGDLTIHIFKKKQMGT